ncbi:hypothetical protein AVEN_89797-1 [Araneus ventricosus]|uniref:Uncharacterized protein n=1 Tax=Araneus ventricosus TaxID=182803 RepID=A0A4Y2I2V2_ARAVE|nr:hypothetical protein AVEN_89797-1 [Araneus ventricosus]
MAPKSGVAPKWGCEGKKNGLIDMISGYEDFSDSDSKDTYTRQYCIDIKFTHARKEDQTSTERANNDKFLSRRHNYMLLTVNIGLVQTHLN